MTVRTRRSPDAVAARRDRFLDACRNKGGAVDFLPELLMPSLSRPRFETPWTIEHEPVRGRQNRSRDALLVIDGNIVSRCAITDDPRRRGYTVVAAAETREAMFGLAEPMLGVDVIRRDGAAIGALSVELAQWVRAHRPWLEVCVAGGIDVAARTAPDLCETGPYFNEPYAPEPVVDYAKPLRPTRHRHQP